MEPSTQPGREPDARPATEPPSWPDQDCPVHIGPLAAGESHRLVRVMREDGTVLPPEPCRDAHDLRRLAHHERPDVDLADPAQLFWDGDPGRWPR